MTLFVIFYPYHFVHAILSNTILPVYHFVHTILSVPFCPLPFCPRTNKTHGPSIQFNRIFYTQSTGNNYTDFKTNTSSASQLWCHMSRVQVYHPADKPPSIHCKVLNTSAAQHSRFIITHIHTYMHTHTRTHTHARRKQINIGEEEIQSLRIAYDNIFCRCRQK